MKDKQARIEKILRLFSGTNITLDDETVNRFSEFYELLIKYNNEYDLTRLTGFNDIIIKHFIDSIYITRLVKIESPLLDIGTGAGFPGIPLKIFSTELSVILAESRFRRVEFLNLAIKKLHLDNIEVFNHMVTEKSFFDVKSVITRAVESVDETLSRVTHFLPRDGSVIFMKGPRGGMEMEKLSDANMRSFTLEKDLAYTLPGTKHRRKLIIYRKTIKDTRRAYNIMKNPEETRGLAINSKENARYRELRKVSTAEGVRKYGKILVSGKKVIKEMIEKRYGENPVPIEMIIYDGYEDRDDSLYSIFTGFNQKGNLLILKKSLFNELDLFNTKQPLLAAAVNEIRSWDGSIEKGCNLAIPFQDPANVGTVVRSAVGFGVKRIIMLEGSAYPYHPKSVRASGGAVFMTDIVKGPSASEFSVKAADSGVKIYSLDKKGDDISTLKFPESFILIPGIEGPGIPDGLKAESLSIPIESIDSYNAAVAASIAMYAWAGGK